MLRPVVLNGGASAGPAVLLNTMDRPRGRRRWKGSAPFSYSRRNAA